MLDGELNEARERLRKLQNQIRVFQYEERKIARAIRFEERRRKLEQPASKKKTFIKKVGRNAAMDSLIRKSQFLRRMEEGP
jgi:hypothetical protein